MSRTFVILRSLTLTAFIKDTLTDAYIFAF